MRVNLAVLVENFVKGVAYAVLGVVLTFIAWAIGTLIINGLAELAVILN